jgi:branched-chain amino acid transport system substrate-binding protein
MRPGRGAGGRPPEPGLSRRSVLRGLGAGALASGAGGVLAACSSGVTSSVGSASGGPISIGFVTPLTGPLAGYASGDRFVLSTIKDTPQYKNGFTVGGQNYKINIMVADSQSDPNLASEAARNLVLNDNVDMLLATSAPETVNPVAAVAETQGVPCVSTVCPWESWYAGLGGNPAKPAKAFTYATLFFFGLKQDQGCFVPMWKQIPAANKTVACMYPDDADGATFRAGFIPLIKESGYKAVDGGAYTDGITDFTTMIIKFLAKNAQYFSNCQLPPDFNIFWKQAHQQGWKPKLATVSKVLQFPADTVALGSLVNNIATNSWWGPYMPHKSSLTGQTASALAAAYEAQTGKQWVQSIGSSYSLFEVAHQAFTAVSDPHDSKAVAGAIHKVNYSGMCGKLNFAGGPAPGVAIMNPVGVQWKKSTGKHPYELKVVDNSLNKAVRIQASLEPTNL